jgi:maltose O-acetyltransferase
MDPELVTAWNRARDLCQALNRTREEDTEERRRTLTELFGAGGDSAWMQPPSRSRSPTRHVVIF